MKTIAIVSVARSDYGIYRPILRRLDQSLSWRPIIVAGGAHLSPDFGMTVNEIERDGFHVAARVPTVGKTDTAQAISSAIGAGVTGFGEAFEKLRPDMVMVLGDRYEMMAGALAAVPFQIPIAHVHGGELSLGAIDDAMRHAMTKLSHLHFVSTEEYGQRVIQMGEEPWRVHTVGAPGLDAIRDFVPFSDIEFANQFGWSLPERFLLLTFHPETLGRRDPAHDFATLAEAVAQTELPTLITMPNADLGGRAIRDQIQEEVSKRPEWHVVESLGTRGYWSAMQRASAMIGNSSSGIIEAASFRLPVVNVGHRQAGRVRGKNVIDAEIELDAMKQALSTALSYQFSENLQEMTNPYGNGNASESIQQTLESLPTREQLIHKVFTDR